MIRGTMHKVLRSRNVRLLYIGTLISDFGSQFGLVALPFAVLRIGDAALLGIVLAARVLPSAAFVLVGGYLADRITRVRLMVSSDVVRACAQFASAVAVIDRSGWAAPALIAAQVTYGTAEAFFTPAARGLMPKLVGEPDLPAANGLMGLTKNITRPTGPAIAGVVVAILGPGWALSIDGLSFLLGVFAVARIDVAATATTGGEGNTRLKGALKQISQRHWLLAMMGTSVIFQAAVLGPVVVGGPEVARALGGAQVWGALLAAGGLGSVIGALVAAHLDPARPLWVMAIAIICTVPYPLALSYAAPLPILLAASLLYGNNMSVVGTIYLTVLHRRIPDQYLGRVLAVDQFCSIAIVPLSQSIAGVFIASDGVSGIFRISAIGVLAAAVVLISPKGARALTRSDEGGPGNEKLAERAPSQEAEVFHDQK